MNILAALFGIFRQRGLVTAIKEGQSLTGFTLAVIVFSIIGGVLYGFAMGIGLGMDVALKDAIKLGLIVALGLLFTIPVFWVAYRLLGREEGLAQVAAVPLTLFATVAIILTVAAPLAFMLSVLAGFSPEAVYIHIVIVDLALLVGLYLAGMLIYHAFSDHKQLIIPNVVGFLMMAVILVVLMSFLAPFLAPRPTFSIGTDRLKDGLGIGVAEKANQALLAARSADRVSYRFQSTNDNGDLIRDYTVTRVGADHLIEVHLHAVPGETVRNQRRCWLLDGQHYTDFADRRITRAVQADLATILDPALPAAAFTLPAEFATASWRALERDGLYNANGTTPSLARTTLELETATGRLSSLTIGSAESGSHAEVWVGQIVPATLDRAGLEASLNQAIVLGSVDHGDASMQDYVQDGAFFVVRYPRTWRAGNWVSEQRRVELSSTCGRSEGCPTLAVTVYDLAEEKGPRQYAEDLGKSLGLQPEYRQVAIEMMTIGDQPVGVVEYLADRTVKGEIETTHHLEYIFEGQLTRYHLDFSAPADRFETNRALFGEMAGLFTYLKGSP